MIPHTLLTTSLLTSTAAAAPLPPPNPLPERATPIPPFKITNFAAGAVILSNRNYINFNVILSPNAPPTHCHALGTTTSETLGSIRQTWCNTTSSSEEEQEEEEQEEEVWFTWAMRQDQPQEEDQQPQPQFQPQPQLQQHKRQGSERASSGGGGGGGGADLRIVRQMGAHMRDEAVLHISGQDTPMVGEGILVHQVYRGREDFEVEAWRYEAF